MVSRRGGWEEFWVVVLPGGANKSQGGRFFWGDWMLGGNTLFSSEKIKYVKPISSSFKFKKKLKKAILVKAS